MGKVRLDSEEAYGKSIAYTFIHGTYNRRTGKLEEDLANQLSLGVNSYPCDLANEIDMIINYNNYGTNPKPPCKEKATAKEIFREIII